MIKAILLDLDLTLLDRDLMFRNFAYELVKRYAPCEEVIEETAETLIIRDEKGYGKRADMYQPLIDAWNLNKTVADFIQEWSDFMEYGVVVYPHAREILLKLKEKYRLGMVTNGLSHIQRGKLQGAGLSDLFEEVVVSGDFDFEKPDARIFQIALERMGIQPEEAVFVGDHPEKDIQGAMQVGMKTVWIDHGTDDFEEYNGLVIQDLTQLPEVLTQYE